MYLILWLSHDKYITLSSSQSTFTISTAERIALRHSSVVIVTSSPRFCTASVLPLSNPPTFLYSTFPLSIVSGNGTMDSHLVPRGSDRNYTGFLTKTIVYSGTLLMFLTGGLRR